MTERYCKICGQWHDLNELWPHHSRQIGKLQIIKDIDPYKAVAIDVATGKPPIIGSRPQHREFLKRNGYIEIGNEKQMPKKPELNKVSRDDIRRAIWEVRNK